MAKATYREATKERAAPRQSPRSELQSLLSKAALHRHVTPSNVVDPPVQVPNEGFINLAFATATRTCLRAAKASASRS